MIEPIAVDTAVGAFLIAFPALFSIVNPIGAAIIFRHVTEQMASAPRRRIARHIAFYALTVLLGALFFGGYVLNFFGVSLGALRIGGGLVVATQAWRLLTATPAYGQQETTEAEVATVSAHRADIAFFPLTVPLTVGPGSIAVSIALASQRPSHADPFQFFLGVAIAAAAIALLIGICFVWADRVMASIGQVGARVMSSVSALILLCIGVQIIGTGVQSFIRP